MVGNGTVGGRGGWWGEHAVRAPVSRGCMNSNEVRPPTDTLVNENCALFCHVKHSFRLWSVTAGISSQSTSQAILHGGVGLDARSSCGPTFAIIAFPRFYTYNNLLLIHKVVKKATIRRSLSNRPQVSMCTYIC